MEQDKRVYYVDLNSGDVLENPIESSPSFRIKANYEELNQLKKCFNELYSADLETFERAHIPYLEYHHDPENHHYDASLKKIYAAIYELGDEEAKRSIEQIGILDERKSNSESMIRKFK